MNDDVSVPVLVIGDHSLSLETYRAIEAANRMNRDDQVIVLGCGSTRIAPPMELLVLEMRVIDCDFQWPSVVKGHQQPHYRVNYKTGKPLKY